MTYMNLGPIGKAIAYNMIDRGKTSLIKECKENDLPYNRIRYLIHDDKKLILFSVEEINKIRNVFDIDYKIIEPTINSILRKK